MKKALISTRVIAAAGAVITATVALIAGLSGWSAEAVALAGGLIAAMLGLWRALASVAKKTSAMMVMMCAALMACCTAAQRQQIATTAITASSDALMCALKCTDGECREGCALTYGAEIASDLINVLMIAKNTGAETVQMMVPVIDVHIDHDEMIEDD